MAMQAERNYTYPVKLPPSIRQRATDMARLDGTSLNYFISTAIAEKMSRMQGRGMDQSHWADESMKTNTPN